MKYLITRTTTQQIEIDANYPGDALDQAGDYSNQNNWSPEFTSYSIVEQQ